jgi:hypothetical protein
VRRATLALLLAAVAVSGARAQPATSRFWRPEERTLVTDLAGVTAVAATQLVVYAATRDALAVYDRQGLTLRDVIGTIDGYPGGQVTAMVADPTDDTAWLGGLGGWAAYQPMSRRFDGGALPGSADQVVLDAGDPSRGAYFHTQAGWYFVRRMGIAAEPAHDVPPPGRRIGALNAQELLGRAPAFDLVRLRIQRDAQLRMWRITSVAMTPASADAFVSTDGNGLYKVDVNRYDTERFPSGLLAAPTGGVAAAGDEVCAGVDARFRSVRRGVTCFAADLSRFSYYEGNAVSLLPGTIVRRVLVTRAAVWAATDQGVLRLDRASGTVRQFDTHGGLPSLDVRALAPAQDGIWIGTARGLALAPEGDGAARTSASMVLDAGVLALAVRGDTLWLGTTAGPFLLPPGAGAPLSAAPDRPELAVPIVALAFKGDTLLAATASRLAWQAGGTWHDAPPPAPSIGQFTAVAPDAAGFWVAGTLGLGFYQPARPLWRALTAAGDVPQPVSDVAASGGFVWAATPLGVVRLERRVLGP